MILSLLLVFRGWKMGERIRISAGLVQFETLVLTLSQQRKMSREGSGMSMEERKMLGGERLRGKEAADVEESVVSRSAKPVIRSERDPIPLIEDTRFREIEKRSAAHPVPLSTVEEEHWALQDCNTQWNERGLRWERLRILEEKESKRRLDAHAALLARVLSQDLLDAFEETGWIRPSKIWRAQQRARIVEQKKYLLRSFGRWTVQRFPPVPVEEWYSNPVMRREFREMSLEPGVSGTGSDIAREVFESEVPERKDKFYPEESVPITERRGNPNIDPRAPNISSETMEYAAGGSEKNIPGMESEMYKGPGSYMETKTADIGSSTAKKPISLGSGHKPAGRR